MHKSLVSSQWLQAKLNDSGALELAREGQGQASADAVRAAGLIIFDATYFLTDKTRDPYQEFLDDHIPGAQYFDITRIADTDSPWPNTVPDAKKFEEAVSALGCNGNHHVIAYDRLGLFSAARVWWLFRYFGHDNVSVLDGGLIKWKADNLALSEGAVNYPAGDFSAVEVPTLIRSAEEVLSVVENTSTEQTNNGIIDARGAGRFAGKSPEPRAGLRSGRIPGSVNLPFEQLLNDDKTFKSADAIRGIFADAGVNLNEPLVTSCGSGVTACIVSLALSQLGVPDVPVFDGSWTEWGSREELPIQNS